jgi:ribosomal peptide maturation radical SAM protein 1
MHSGEETRQVANETTPSWLVTDTSAQNTAFPQLRSGAALIIVPPFQDLNRPSLAAHILQACAGAVGIPISVLYANLAFAASIGEEAYDSVSGPTSSLGGERLFAPAAYGPAVEARGGGSPHESAGAVSGPGIAPEWVAAWTDAVAREVAGRDFRVVGCTTMFQQTSASVALVRRIKQLRPDVVTVIGGANCEGEMAEGIASLSPALDFVFSGESEASFVAFLQQVLTGSRPATRIVQGEPCRNMDALPTPHYGEFYEQLQHWLPDSGAARNVLIPAESSRGCWWGQKHHCTFCGLNGQTIAFREKSPERVIAELRTLLAESPSQQVVMADNIMPHTYFRTLIPRLGQEVPDLKLFYEQKANLSLAQVIALKQAGVNAIQPGIEALSSSLLKRMDKGVSAAQNVALLRYARSVGIWVTGNLLAGLPGDELCDYEETLSLVPLLGHLNPPTGVSDVSIERFSPYFDRPQQYGITNVRRIDAYALAFPPAADLGKLAYHFDADFASGARAHPEIVQAIGEAVERWRAQWRERDGDLPALVVRRLADDAFVLRDTRGLPGTQDLQFLTRRQAAIALVGRGEMDAGERDWALASRVGVELDGAYVPLATAGPELLLEFETAQRLAEPGRPPGGARGGRRLELTVRGG